MYKQMLCIKSVQLSENAVTYKHLCPWYVHRDAWCTVACTHTYTVCSLCTYIHRLQLVHIHTQSVACTHTYTVCTRGAHAKVLT